MRAHTVLEAMHLLCSLKQMSRAFDRSKNEIGFGERFIQSPLA